MKKIEPGIVLAIVLLSVVIVLQAITMHTLNDLGKSIEMLAGRSSASPFSFPYESLHGYVSLDLQADPTYYQEGKVIGIVRSELMAKTPGSRVVLRYRLNEGDQWQKVVMEQGDPLQYLARLQLDAAAKVEYQQLQTVGDEIVQASGVRTADMSELVGSGDVSVHYTQQQGAKDITFYFENTARVETLQVAEISLKVNKTKPEDIILNGDPWTCTFDNAGFEDMNVTVTYKDGTVRSATYNFLSPDPLIKR